MAPSHTILPYVLISVLAFVSIYITNAVDVDYTAKGPCSFAKHTACIGGCGNLKVTTTVPKKECSSAPHPVVVFFNGFQVPSSANKDYTTKLASYGYAVVEYDVTPMRFIPDELELPIMQQILVRLQQLASKDASGPYSRMDFNWIAVAGYSRGAALAALQLARNSSLQTAYLIDPVDSTVFTPNGILKPSAADELRRLPVRRTAGISAGGITATCNPKGTGYDSFYSALGTGSWLQVLPSVSHLAFARVPARYMPVCGWGGNMTADDAISISAATCVAWLEHVRTGQEAPENFRSWIQGKVEAGVMSFDQTQ